MPSGVVVVASLRLRSGPSTSTQVLASLPNGARFDLLDRQDPWLQVRVTATGQTGFLHQDFVLLDGEGSASGFLVERPEIATISLPPDSPAQVPPNSTSAIRQVARTWNRVGGLVKRLALLLKIEPAVAISVLSVESGGQAFSPDGRMIIRFENHVFFRKWGKDHPDDFAAFFEFNPTKPWLGHTFRSARNQPRRSFHGDPTAEWDVFDFASSLDRDAARRSISMGAPQIMGFNHSLIGYESAVAMFDAFTAGERAQIVGLFDFIQGPHETSTMLLAVQRQDFSAFAAVYNGPANAAEYSERIARFVHAFTALQVT